MKKTGERRSEFGKYTTANVRKRKRVGSNEIPQDNGSMMVYPEQISHDHSLPKTVPSSHSFNAALSSSAEKVNECSDMIFNENPVHSSVIENLGNFQESNLTFDSEKTGVTEETFSKYAFMKSTTESFDEMVSLDSLTHYFLMVWYKIYLFFTGYRNWRRYITGERKYFFILSI